MARAGEFVLSCYSSEEEEIGGGIVRSDHRSSALDRDEEETRFHLASRGYADPDIFMPIFSPPIPPSFTFRRPKLWISSDSDSDSASDYAEDLVASDIDPFARSPAQRDGSGEMIPFNGDSDLFPSMGDSVSHCSPLETGQGLALSVEEEEDGGEDRSDSEDALFVDRSSIESMADSGDGRLSSSLNAGGLQMMGSRSNLDTDSEEEDAISEICPHSDGESEPDRVADDLAAPVFMDYLSIDEDGRNPDEDFGGEEFDGMERELLDIVIGDDESYYSSEWEVFLAVDELDGEISDEHEIADSLVAEDHESFINGNPPAARSVITHLPSISLTEKDVADNNNLCVVCKVEISVEETVKQLPCLHHFHAECILPWLRMRNTCPLCRFELPADEPDFLDWRAQRAGGSGAFQESHVAVTNLSMMLR